uniref:Uncharacterized protein n=1 Tax=Anguilla anguilla TaxID=7936 RepID=A0A0E9P891_ANGAN
MRFGSSENELAKFKTIKASNY